jgi:hypothetical protein
LKIELNLEMKASIYSHQILIGSAFLNIGDENMGHLIGEFIPTEEYYKGIQESVWKVDAGRKLDVEKWKSLRLNVQLKNGYFLFPAGGLTIDDSPQFPNESKKINMAGIDSEVLNDYFKATQEKDFVLEPWEVVSIEQKLSFEDELFKELGKEEKTKSLFTLFKSKADNHFLVGCEISSLCHSTRTDDILFHIRKEGFAKRLALVHLTWKGAKELKGWPKVRFYSDFKEFQKVRMVADKIDCDGSEIKAYWYPFDRGKTINSKGSESGIIIEDIENSYGARISLEKCSSVPPFAITLGVYGMFFHTHYDGTIDNAIEYVSRSRELIDALFRLMDIPEEKQSADWAVEKEWLVAKITD